MPSKETRLRSPAFGHRLRGLRESKGWDLPIVGRKLRALKISVQDDTLYAYEQGRREKIDPVTLWGYSEIFAVPLDGLIRELHWSREHPTSDTLPRALPEVPGMRVTGDEEGLVRMVRQLEAADHAELMEFIAFKLKRAGGRAVPAGFRVIKPRKDPGA